MDFNLNKIKKKSTMNQKYKQNLLKNNRKQKSSSLHTESHTEIHLGQEDKKINTEDKNHFPESYLNDSSLFVDDDDKHLNLTNIKEELDSDSEFISILEDKNPNDISKTFKEKRCLKVHCKSRKPCRRPSNANYFINDAEETRSNSVNIVYSDQVEHLSFEDVETGNLEEITVKNEIEICNTEFIYDEAIVNAAKHKDDNSGQQVKTMNFHDVGLKVKRKTLNFHESNVVDTKQVTNVSKTANIIHINDGHQLLQISEKPSKSENLINSKYKNKKFLLTDNKCAVCQKPFKFQRDLVKHVQVFNHSGKAFKCRYCSKRFSKLQNIPGHTCDKNSKSAYVKHYKNNLQNNLNSCEKVLSTTVSTNYNCSICNEIFDVQQTLLEHLQTYHNSCQDEHQSNTLNSSIPKTKYNCEYCSKIFSLKDSLKTHIKVEHSTRDRPLQYRCSLCNKTFKFINSLKYHQEYTHKNLTNRDLSKKYNCEFCSKSFNHMQALKYHLLIHTGEKPFKCSFCQICHRLKTGLIMHQKRKHIISEDLKCIKCLIYFISQETLDSHLLIHAGEKPLQCSFCPISFSDRKSLIVHQKKKHFISKDLKCSICRIYFLNQEALESHLSIDHTEKCSFCQISFKDKWKLIGHQKQDHAISKDLKCTKCHIYFLNQETLERHLLTHTGFNCSFCQIFYMNKTRLISHQEKHHVTSKDLKCSNCQLYFVNQEILSLHINTTHINTTHTKQIINVVDAKELSRNTICEFCGEEYSSNPTLKRHLKIHTKENPFSCSWCQIPYKDKRSLIFHQKRKHNFSHDLKCSNCDIYFPNQQILSMHIKTTHKDDKHSQTIFKQYLLSKDKNCDFNLSKDLTKGNICKYCHKSFRVQSALDVHLRTHTGETPFSCSICKRSFKANHSLKNHLKKTHNIGEDLPIKKPPKKNTYEKEECPYACSLCEKKFKQQISLDSHHQQTHINVCQLCNMTFTSKPKLTIHTRLQHNAGGSFNTCHSKQVAKKFKNLKSNIDSSSNSVDSNEIGDRKTDSELSKDSCETTSTQDAYNVEEEEFMENNKSVDTINVMEITKTEDHSLIKDLQQSQVVFIQKEDIKFVVAPMKKK